MQNIQFSAMSHFPLYSHCSKPEIMWFTLPSTHLHCTMCMANTSTIYNFSMYPNFSVYIFSVLLVCLKPLNTYCLCQVLHHINDKRPTGDPILHPAQATIVSLQLWSFQPHLEWENKGRWSCQLFFIQTGSKCKVYSKLKVCSVKNGQTLIHALFFMSFCFLTV